MLKLLRISISFFILCGCSTPKPISLNPNNYPRTVTIIYDQRIREFPNKNPTNNVIPAIYLPLQQKAFQLDRTQRFARKVLVLRFDQSDDTSIIRIMANRFSFYNWLYADTILAISSQTELNTCYRIHINTYRNKEFGFVPQLSLVPFVCKGDEEIVYSHRILVYDVPTQTITATDKRIYRKKRYESLFKRNFLSGGSVLKVSDVIK
jgi:hypothetical protein